MDIIMIRCCENCHETKNVDKTLQCYVKKITNLCSRCYECNLNIAQECIIYYGNCEDCKAIIKRKAWLNSRIKN